MTKIGEDARENEAGVGLAIRGVAPPLHCPRHGRRDEHHHENNETDWEENNVVRYEAIVTNKEDDSEARRTQSVMSFIGSMPIVVLLIAILSVQIHELFSDEAIILRL